MRRSDDLILRTASSTIRLLQMTEGIAPVIFRVPYKRFRVPIRINLSAFSLRPRGA